MNAGSQSLGASFFGRKALGKSRDFISALSSFGAFGGRKDALDETFAISFERLADTLDVRQIATDADNHGSIIAQEARGESARFLSAIF
jgi:hypothetical protein